MPSIRYVNQSAPFWDFVASLEREGSEHPFFARNDSAGRDRDASEGQAWGAPWGWGWPGMSQRGHHDPPPPFESGDDAPPPPPAPPGGDAGASPPPGPPGEPGAPPPPHEGRHRGHHGPWGGHRRGRCGRGGGFARGPGGGPWAGPWGRRGGGPFNMGGLADFIQSQMSGESNEGSNEDFKPECDIFDTELAYVVHLSLPGAKKEDIAVNWDAEKSELSVAGVTFRPGDEDFLKTLALDERSVGAFERKVRLGSRANPAQVDVDGISAKLEDGILIVTVPKEDKDFVEVKKVDIL